MRRLCRSERLSGALRARPQRLSPSYHGSQLLGIIGPHWDCYVARSYPKRTGPHWLRKQLAAQPGMLVREGRYCRYGGGHWGGRRICAVVVGCKRIQRLVHMCNLVVARMAQFAPRQWRSDRLLPSNSNTAQAPTTSPRGSDDVKAWDDNVWHDRLVATAVSSAVAELNDVGAVAAQNITYAFVVVSSLFPHPHTDADALRRSKLYPSVRRNGDVVATNGCDHRRPLVPHIAHIVSRRLS